MRPRKAGDFKTKMQQLGIFPGKVARARARVRALEKRRVNYPGSGIKSVSSFAYRFTD